MSSYQQTAKVLKNEEIGPGIFRLHLFAYDIAQAARPGQFVMIKAANGLDPLLRRPFSIHQVTAKGTIHILFKVIGKGTTFLSQLKEGDTVDILGPLGNSFPIRQKGGICLVGGGMGIAPIFFLAKEIMKTTKEREIIVILGARNKAEINRLLIDFDELGVKILHSTDDGSSGHHGFVTDLLVPAIQTSEENDWQVACCGPTIMMQRISSICGLHHWPCHVSMETMMACGMGACLGCTIKRSAQRSPHQSAYLHTCKDGPIFNSEEILWPVT